MNPRLRTSALVSAVAVLLAATAPSKLPDDPCDGCGAVASVGLANPGLPNDPNQNGNTDPGANDGDTVSDDDGELLFDVVTPRTAVGFLKFSTSGNADPGFKSRSGDCEEDDPNQSGATPIGGDCDCPSGTSCEWEAGRDVTFVIQVDPRAPSTTMAMASANLPQSSARGGTNLPMWTLKFEDGQVLSPGCGGEIEYVMTWNGAGGTPQRFELSFRCMPCKPAEGDGSGS